MTNSNSEINELKTLQVEAEGLKGRRKGSRSKKTSEANQQSEPVEDVRGEAIFTRRSPWRAIVRDGQCGP